MNKIILLLSLLAMSICAENYAVLVAGSKDFVNYRHQSNVYHTYQVLVQKGMKPENIIVMAYDDIANNSRNPFKGKVFNKPNGPDVYEGIKIDYTGADVTPTNFVNVLLGDAEAMKEIGTGRVLESTEEDNVFLLFDDHGGDNVISFPKTLMYQNDLNAALQKMYDNKKYKQLVFYMEACHSGSMFNEGKLPNNTKIFVTTSANPTESSYGCYCGSEAKVNGTSIGACLGGQYATSWLEQLDELEDLTTVTLAQQYKHIVEKTTKSHASNYGDMSFQDLPLSDFFTANQGEKKKTYQYFMGLLDDLSDEYDEKDNVEHELVKDEDMKLYYLKQLAEESDDINDIEAYETEVKMAARTKMIFDLFKKEFNLGEKRKNKNIDFDCYKRVVEHYENLCGFDVDRDIFYFKHFADFCTKKLSSWKAYHALNEICSSL